MGHVGQTWSCLGELLNHLREIIGLVFARLGFSIAFCVAIILFGPTNGVLRANALSAPPLGSVITPIYPHLPPLSHYPG